MPAHFPVIIYPGEPIGSFVDRNFGRDATDALYYIKVFSEYRKFQAGVYCIDVGLDELVEYVSIGDTKCDQYAIQTGRFESIRKSQQKHVILKVDDRRRTPELANKIEQAPAPLLNKSFNQPFLTPPSILGADALGGSIQFYQAESET